MQSLGPDIRQLSGDADQLQVAFLDNLMCKVFPDVNGLDMFPAANDVVSPFNACSVGLVQWGRLLLCKVLQSAYF